jgi:hypothetical protein
MSFWESNKVLESVFLFSQSNAIVGRQVEELFQDISNWSDILEKQLDISWTKVSLQHVSGE